MTPHFFKTLGMTATFASFSFGPTVARAEAPAAKFVLEHCLHKTTEPTDPGLCFLQTRIDGKSHFVAHAADVPALLLSDDVAHMNLTIKPVSDSDYAALKATR